MPQVIEEQTHPQEKCSDGRAPTKAERVRLALVRAESGGLTPRELSRQIYGRANHTYRIVSLIQNLRRHGVRILTVYRVGHIGGRYVLAEFLAETHG